ncbi:ATP-binding protein [Pelagibius sp. Alg239-R121]|uniref:AAA family ATPase n=1 Tax=Pelagibius sp. Alg239-R121 TaxID=2993448 RepID=UPI0024A6BA7A|nr:ATP-binding protein [Pelagibius sp. Alg239-R121]
MSENQPTLHLLCGKIAAGKSTLASHLASEPKTILISEDVWMARLYPGEVVALDDYTRCSGRLKEVMGPHAEALLNAGISVVLDFPANTLHQRRWLRGIFESARAAHKLHHLDVPDEICKARLRQRNLQGAHNFTPSDDDFDLITSYFVPPSSEEGFDIIRYDAATPPTQA